MSSIFVNKNCVYICISKQVLFMKLKVKIGIQHSVTPDWMSCVQPPTPIFAIFCTSSKFGTLSKAFEKSV